MFRSSCLTFNPDDLKIILLRRARVTHQRSCHVYSFKTRSWETALWLGDRWYKYMQDAGTFVNGFLYWIAHKHGLGRLILALDIKKMRFSEIEFPTKRTFSSITLESWSQIYSSNLLSRGNYLYGFESVSILDEGKIVMLKDSNQVIIHDITKDSNKEVKALTTPYDISRTQIIEYVETLVSPSNLLLLMTYSRAALTEPPKPFTPTPVIFTPNTVVALSAHTCGVADDAFKASIIKRYRRKKNSATSGITHEVSGASLLKSHHEDLGESSEAVVACSSAPTAGSG
ncbi:hypothetical protein Tco_1180993 [Tanacetum coccineum]